jgi:hypothetical protein
MKTTIRILLACTFVALSMSTAFAQGTARDTRTAPPAPLKGTSQLSVVVSTDEPTSRPLRRVSVSLQAGEIDVPNIGVTDDEGRVVFRNLAAGNYLLSAMRAGYVRTYYGSKLPGRGPGIAITVLDAQKVGDIQIRMPRGSVLTGAVRTATGRPAPNQVVQAIMVRSSAGERRASALEAGQGSAVTDDRGVYRMFGLAPGDYVVLVPSTAFGSEELRPMTAAELQWADSVVAGGTTTAPATGMPAAPTGAASVAYAPVYYPGTSVVNDAGVITLRPNEERSGVDFSLQFVPTAQITGRVVDPDGRPMNGISVTLRPARTDGMDLFSSIFNASARTGADGTFTARGVKPGAYTMTARATPQATPAATTNAPPNPAAMMQQEMAAIMGGGAGFTHFAQEDVAVQGRDISDVVLTLRPGMTMTGRIVYEATTKTAPTDFSKTGLVLMTAPTGSGVNDLVGSLMGQGSTPLKIEPDGSFTVKGIAPGRYRLNTPMSMMAMAGVPSMAGGWTLKGAVAGGRDISDSPIEIRAGVDVPDVVVTFTDQPSELTGTVIDGAGRATPDFPIVVFSTDRAYWTLGSRRVQTARPASDGKYKVTGLPAGEYFVSAVTAVDRTEAYDPAFLSQLVGASFKITIKDGEKKTQDLKLGGG